MKSGYLFLGSLFIFLSAFTQQPNPPKTDDSIYELSEYDQLAEFPGGIKALIQFIDTNLIHPVQVLRDGVGGKVALRFVIEKDGSISNVSVLKGIPNCMECNEEAGKVIRNMPKWTPAYRFTRTNTTHILDDTLRVFMFL